MTEAAWPPWPERVARRPAPSRREMLLLVFLGVIAVLTAHAGTIATWQQLLAWAVSALVGVGVGLVSAVMLSALVRSSFARARSPRLQALLVIASGAATGVAFGLGVWCSARWLQLEDPEPLWWSILGSALIVAWFEIVFSLSLDARMRIRSEVDSLIEEAIALEAARLTTSTIVTDIQSRVTAGVHDTLLDARAGLPQAPSASDAAAMLPQWQDIASALRSTTAQTVRPLSRRLWESAPAMPDRPRPWSLLTYVLAHQPLRPLAVSALFVLGSGSSTIREQPWAVGVVQLALGALCIFAVMVPANALMRRSPRLHTTLFVGAALLLQVPVVLAYLLPRDAVGPRESPGGMVATVLAGLVVIVATSAFGAITAMSRQRLDTLSTEIDQAFVEAAAQSATLARLLKEASGIVHGAVQSRLLGCAIAIEEAGRNRDPEQFSAALARALDALENPVASLGRPRASTVHEELARRRDLWDGLCDVTYTVRGDVTGLAPATIEAIGRITEEAIANAVRHGEAQHVDITIDLVNEKGAEGRLRITVIDDGQGLPVASLRPGLGMRMIDAMAASRSLLRLGDRTSLIVHLDPN